MWWILSFIAIILISKLDDILDFFKSKSPDYEKEKEQQRQEKAQERAEIIQQLKASIDLDCQIESDDLYYVTNSSNKVNATIISVDDNWVELIIRKKRKKRKLLLRNKNISSVSRIL